VLRVREPAVGGSLVVKIRVLGSAAGGGFPQWNCNCPNCAGLRRGTIRARARTQSSIAASADGASWVLINASPDILTQLRAWPASQPARAIRDTAIVAVVLTDSQIDHTTGLLMLREGRALRVFCTDNVRDDLTGGNPLFRVLGHYCGVESHRIAIGEGSFSIAGAQGLSLRAVALASKAPPYSPHRDRPGAGDNIGIVITDAAGKSLFYAPGLATIEPHIAAIFESADCLLVDGTFWSDDEMIRLEISPQRAQDMGHLALSGPGGMVEAVSRHARARKCLIHINNTNPVLDEDSPERAQLAAAGIEVAHDGMEIVV
jgi:pyrroloquinoline quinone biosynthesis protein B